MPSAWLFDIGNSPELLQPISKKKIDGLFVTHAHLDHIWGINDFLKHQPNCPVFGSRLCLSWINDDKRNLSFYYERPINALPFTPSVLEDNSVIPLSGKVHITAIQTPGHTEDSMSFILDDIVITGDAYIPGVPPVTKLKGGNKEKFAESLVRIKEYIRPTGLVLPGHGPIYNGSNPDIVI